MHQQTNDRKGLKNQMAKSCKWCKSTDHTQFFCRQKPRTPIKTNKLPNKIGKAQKKTNAAVAKWKRTQPSTHAGYWKCYICHRLVDYLIAEHVLSKVRHPERRTDPKNMKPVCNECNRLKASKDN